MTALMAPACTSQVGARRHPSHQGPQAEEPLGTADAQPSDMAPRSHAPTAQLESSSPTAPDIHSRTTRIVRRRRDASDDRKTLVCVTATRGAVCRTCSASFDQDAQFCGMCGDRARVRASLVGKVVDELYEVDDKLADGATATIYRARYLPSGQEVALKVLHPELAFDRTAVARFRREGKVLGRLRDAHTVAVYDHGETADGTVYIAMELVRGEGLDVRVRTRGAVPWRDALSIMRGVCSSLEETHAHGIVHRGLTPANIRLDRNDGVKLIDFGLAKVRPDAADEELTFAGQAIGSLQYMAPEQVVGRTCDGRADLYALGLIGLEMILGRARRPTAAPAILPASIPREVERLLQRCLASDPSDRVPNAVELGREIDRILVTPAVPVDGEPVATPARVFPHTPAFELQPPRIGEDVAPLPAFLAARGSEPELELSAAPARGRWRLLAAALVIGGVGVATAVVGCV